AGCGNMLHRPAPSPTTTKTANTNFVAPKSHAADTPCTRAATAGDGWPSAADSVERIKFDDGPLAFAQVVVAASSATADSATPRLVKRLRKRSRPRSNRPRSRFNV